MNVLVTGATGYIGVTLVRRLPEDMTPIALVRDASRTELLPDDVETVEGDITDSDTLTDPMDRVDGVIHMAAVNPGSKNSPRITNDVAEEVFDTVNVEGTRTVLDAAAEADVSSVVYLSTTKCHPDVEGDDDESLYVRTKREGGRLLTEGSYPFEYSIVHPTYVMGPRDYRLKRLEPFRLAASNRILVPPLYTPGRINVVHVDTIADSIWYYLRRPTNNRHLVSGPNVDRQTFRKTIAAQTDHRTVTASIPGKDQLLPAAVWAVDRIGLANVDPDRLVLDSETGIVPEVHEQRAPVERKSWQEAVRDTYAWYESAGLL